MSLVISYKPFFEVKILHHYFLNKGLTAYESLTQEQKDKILSHYAVSSFMNFIPTVACARILRNHGCVFRNTKMGIMVWVKIKIDEEGKIHPFNEMADDLKFTFKMVLADQNFLNYTSLPLLNHEGKIYSFNNQRDSGGKKTKDYPYLSRFPSVFGNKPAYSMGDLLIDHETAPARLFTARKITSISPVVSAADWTEVANSPDTLKPFQYANENDLVPLDLPLKKELSGGNAIIFGMTEISLRSDNPAFDLLDSEGYLLKKAGKLSHPIFEIRFMNRMTGWRYLGKNFAHAPVTDDPMPLTKFGMIPVSMNNNEDETVEGLPNPAVSMIKVELNEEKTAYDTYSETYIN